MKVLIKNATLISPSSPLHGKIKSIFIDNGTISRIGSNLKVNADQIIHIKGLCVSLGWMDCFANFCDPGQEFKEHCDWFDPGASYWPDEVRRGGQRSWTAMAYLNDVEAGGVTAFTRIGVEVTPERGLLLIWNNATRDGDNNLATMHAARPVEVGVKYVITKWFRTRRWT